MSEHRLHSPPVVDSPVSVLKKISEQLGEVIARLYAIEHDVKDAADYQVRQDGARADVYKRQHRAAPEAGGGIARSAPSVEGVAAPGLGSVEHLTQE